MSDTLVETLLRDGGRATQVMTTQNDNRYYAYNTTRETFVATEAKLADGYFSRLVGLLGKSRRWARPGQGLWIIPCHGVHTIGMLFSIDLVFLDAGKRVVHTQEHVGPFRISRVILKAASVLSFHPTRSFAAERKWVIGWRSGG